jgi:hypothetical protein
MLSLSFIRGRILSPAEIGAAPMAITSGRGRTPSNGRHLARVAGHSARTASPRIGQHLITRPRQLAEGSSRSVIAEVNGEHLAVRTLMSLTTQTSAMTG